ncbi:hypothetical protein ACROYT_G006826 [Oculina patagonica]
MSRSIWRNYNIESCIEVDITGTSNLKPGEETGTVENKTLIEQLASWNPCFLSLEGNPHSQVVNEDE